LGDQRASCRLLPGLSLPLHGSLRSLPVFLPSGPSSLPGLTGDSIQGVGEELRQGDAQGLDAGSGLPVENSRCELGLLVAGPPALEEPSVEVDDPVLRNTRGAGKWSACRDYRCAPWMVTGPRPRGGG
jgi:hypothetical protein